MTKKEKRQLIFNKYNGHCAYCGDPLQKGWHIDEKEPVVRKTKVVPAGWFHKVTGARILIFVRGESDNYKWKARKIVSDGCMYPERLNFDNQMPACASCNINKHSGTVEEFRALIQGFMKHLNEINTQYEIAKRYGLVKEDIKPVVFYFETIKN